MKTKSIMLILMLFSSIMISAQHPLIGTWEMVSIKGTDADGNRVDWNNANIREIKIITPTHYMLIQHLVRNDSVIFNTAHAGIVKVEGNKYIETPTVTSAATSDIAKTDFTWKVKGDQFIQAGTITLPNGKKIILDELVFKKISGSSANAKNPVVGTWNQLSSEYTLFDGTKGSHTSPAVTRFDIFTPAHWMRIGHWEGKFQSAMGGSYSIQNNIIMPSLTVASYPIDNTFKPEITYRLEGSKLYVNGTATNADGKKMIWSDVFQKVGDK
jgi:hypothetical protein